MMPLAPTSIMAMPTSKPKIGFSIDSIVGNGMTKSPGHFSPNSEGSERPMSPLSDCSYPPDIHRNNLINNNNNNSNVRSSSSPSDIHRTLRIPNCSPNELQQQMNNRLQNTTTPTNHHRNTHRLPESPPHQQNSPIRNDSMGKNSPSPIQTRLTPDEPRIRRSRSPSPHQPSKGPIIVPGIPAGLVRPFPVAPPNMGDMKNLPYMTNDMVAAQNPHFLAAQFQVAAALAHGQGQGFPPGGLQHPGHLGNPNVPRESYPLYPWLLSRHGRIFPHRFPGSPHFTDFLLQPFRKPKRVRTAFSPSQLLKLEHAFESNHYVVGAERKTLAQALSLTETQVKVWFQNRRTKHKRMQQEEDAKNGGTGSKMPSSPGNNNSHISYDEDELIDMEMDDCPSGDESDPGMA